MNPPRLVALSPGTLASDSELAGFRRAAGEALEAGLRGILLREPALSDRASFALASALRALCERFEGAWLGVHDRVHVALAARADAAHLGFRSLAPAVAHEVARGALAIGYSAHAHDGPDAAQGADFAFLGPVLDTPSKRGFVDPLGFEGFEAARARLVCPVWAIGGLRPEHAARALAAGARGIAVLGGIFGSARPAEGVRDYLAGLG